MRRLLRKLWPMGKHEKLEIADDKVILPHVCDACHLARATYLATHWGWLRTLYFCGAHARKHKKALKDQGWDIREVS